MRDVLLWTLLVVTTTAGCASGSGHGAAEPGPAAEDGEEARAEDPGSDSPRRAASQRLVREGRLRLEAGRPAEAAEILERAVRLDTSNGRAYLALARARLTLGETERARGLLERAVDLLGPHPEEAARADSLLSTLEPGR